MHGCSRCITSPASEKDKKSVSVNAIRQWLGQLPKPILSATGLDETQAQLSKVDRLGPKQRPATVDVIAKQLGKVSERLSQEPGLLRTEDDRDHPAVADVQEVVEPSEPAQVEHSDERGGDCAEAAAAADTVPESSGPQIEEAPERQGEAL